MNKSIIELITSEQSAKAVSVVEKTLGRKLLKAISEQATSVARKTYGTVQESFGADEQPEFVNPSDNTYAVFFANALKKFGVNGPEDFRDEATKKQFFQYVDNNWKAQDSVQGMASQATPGATMDQGTGTQLPPTATFNQAPQMPMQPGSDTTSPMQTGGGGQPSLGDMSASGGPDAAVTSPQGSDPTLNAMGQSQQMGGGTCQSCGQAMPEPKTCQACGQTVLAGNQGGLPGQPAPGQQVQPGADMGDDNSDPDLEIGDTDQVDDNGDFGQNPDDEQNSGFGDADNGDETGIAGDENGDQGDFGGDGDVPDGEQTVDTGDDLEDGNDDQGDPQGIGDDDDSEDGDEDEDQDGDDEDDEDDDDPLSDPYSVSPDDFNSDNDSDDEDDDDDDDDQDDDDEDSDGDFSTDDDSDDDDSDDEDGDDDGDDDEEVVDDDSDDDDDPYDDEDDDGDEEVVVPPPAKKKSFVRNEDFGFKAEVEANQKFITEVLNPLIKQTAKTDPVKNKKYQMAKQHLGQFKVHGRRNLSAFKKQAAMINKDPSLSPEQKMATKQHISATAKADMKHHIKMARRTKAAYTGKVGGHSHKKHKEQF